MTPTLLSGINVYKQTYTYTPVGPFRSESKHRVQLLHAQYKVQMDRRLTPRVHLLGINIARQSVVFCEGVL